jgi:hypothetical protein
VSTPFPNPARRQTCLEDRIFGFASGHDSRALKDGLQSVRENQGFVSGHDFSRAVSTQPLFSPWDSRALGKPILIHSLVREMGLIPSNARMLTG